MTDDWIVDVLDDLGEFARQNGMHRLTAHLKAASEVAQHELAGLCGVALGDVAGDAQGARPDRRWSALGDRP